MKKIIVFVCLLFVIVTACDSNVRDNISNNVSNNNVSSNVSSDDVSNNDEKSNEPNLIESSNDTGLEAIIPDGWEVLVKSNGEFAIAEGDLNKDDIPDIALVIEKTSIDPAEFLPRSLLIAFGTEDGAYSLSIIADKVVLGAEEGGIWGDPFEDLTIDRGSVVVSDYGGSNWRWYNKYRFRYQDEDWYLIGATMGEYYAGTHTRENANEADYNLLTGDYIIRTTNEDGEIVLQKGNRGRKDLIKLRDFNLADF